MRRELTPLRLRSDGFADLVRGLLADIPEAAGRTLTPSALHILEGHSWPGNVRELRTVLTAAAVVNHVGDIVESDLPAAYRISPRRRHLGLLEQAEHDTIVTVLAEEAGNKSRAAARLGIGRNTLYERIRRLGIPT